MRDLILIVSQFALIVFAMWLLALAYVAIFHTIAAKFGLSKFGSTPLIHFEEHIFRALIGLAFIGVADVSSYPLAFKIIGAFLMGSSIVIMLLPRRWHHGYSTYWSEKLSPVFIRIAGVVTIAVAWWIVRALPGASL